MIKIGVIAHSIDMMKAYQESVILDSSCQFFFEIGTPSQAGEIALRMVAPPMAVDAIIASKMTSRAVAHLVSVPVIPLYLNNYDVTRALCHALRLGKKPAFVEIDLLNRHYNFHEITSLLDVSANTYRFESTERLPQLFDRILSDGCDVVMTMGITTRAYAKQIGMRLVSFFQDVQTFRAAVAEIKNIFAERNKVVERSKWLNAIVENATDGILALDRNGSLAVINTSAKNALEISRPTPELIHKPLFDISETSPLLENIIHSGNDTEVVQNGEKAYIVSKVDVTDKSTFLGSVVTINELQNIQHMELSARRKLSETGFVAPNRFEDIKGTSRPIRDAKAIARQFAITDSTILITGESGSGKEIFAQSIHNSSLCKNGPFVAFNCTTLSDSLLESELFGYESEAFTGARKGGKAGLFELAHRGTLFIDEIGEMPLPIQAKLLRVLQERNVRRVGGEKNIPIQVRFIFATNRNLAQEVQNGTFRADLFYRINVLSLRIPPLRERREDIPLLAEYIVHQIAQRRSGTIPLPLESLSLLQDYDWPGNVRELHNVLERLIALRLHTPAEVAQMIRDLKLESNLVHSPSADDQEISSVPEDHLLVPIGSMHEMENAIIKMLYERYGHSKRQVEKTLELSNVTVWRRLKEANL